MGSDSADEREDYDPDDPDAPAVLPRNPKPSKLKALIGDTPAVSVASSLDDFISKANQKLLDVKDTPTRETELEAKVADLEKKLAAAEDRARRAESTDEPVMPTAPSRGWGRLMVAFVLGCGATFALTTLLPAHEQNTAAITPPAETEKVAAPQPQPEPQPERQPEPQVQPTPPAPEPSAEPEPTHAETATAPTPAPDKTEIVSKKSTTKHPKASHETHATPAAAKPAEGAQNGSDSLYNPF